jgi:hypothetical protein
MIPMIGPSPTPDTEVHALVYRLTPIRWPLVRIWLLRAIGFALLGQAILLAPLAFVFGQPARSATFIFFAFAIVVSLALAGIGWCLLMPRFSVLFLRRFDDRSAGLRMTSLLNAYLTPYFKVLALHDVKTNPVSLNLSGTAGCLLGYAGVLLASSLYSLLIPGGASLWILLLLWFLLFAHFCKTWR